MEKSMSTGKTFRGALSFCASDSGVVGSVVADLCGGLVERLEEDRADHHRAPQLMILSAKLNSVDSNSVSRSSKAPVSFYEYVRVAI